jgi:asparagine synthase (glutamine-hydrolysing)
VIGIGGAAGLALVERLLPDLAHRGPDGQGVWSSAELTLGHRRLAIIGLDPGGAQPMTSSSGLSVITFNGEIYNYLEIADRLESEGRKTDRRYDTRVLVDALEAWGEAALPLLNGMFAFAWYRPQAGRIWLVRDRWGKKPLFWGRVALPDGPALVFSSELRTFRVLPGGPPPPDPLGVARYLVYDGNPGTHTVYRGVAKVPAAAWIEVDIDGHVRSSGRYWRYSPTLDREDVADPIEAFESRLTRALELRLRAEVPVGLFLSGGIDSSLLASTWRRLRPDDRIRTFTVGFADPSYDERVSARQIAQLIQAEHHELVLDGQDLERELDAVWERLSEPFADPSILPMSLLSRFARREVTVALGGDGADEVQAGYDPFRAWLPARRLERLIPRAWLAWIGRKIERALPVDARNMSTRFKVHHFVQGLRHPPEERIQGWLASFPPTELLTFLDPDLAREVDLDQVLEPTRRAFSLIGSAGADLAGADRDLRAQINVWIETYLECCILTKVDRAGMMHSLEIRAPFLDPDLAELLLHLPQAEVWKNGRGKALMRRVASARLPEPILRKPKKGLGVPQATWLRTILRERMEQALTECAGFGWYKSAAIGRLWAEHLSGREDHRRALWNFLFSFPFQKARTA